MTENQPQLHQLLAKLEQLLQKQDSFAREIEALRHEIEALKDKSSKPAKIPVSPPSINKPIQSIPEPSFASTTPANPSYDNKLE